MLRWASLISILSALGVGSIAALAAPDAMAPHCTLAYESAVDPQLQARIEAIDAQLRARFGMNPDQTAVGVLDLRTCRLAMTRPDAIEYGASVPKIGILLAWFHEHPEPAALTPEIRHELGLMIKQSDNAIAASFSQELGLRRIQAILNADGFYDPKHGGGIWVGKHYATAAERYLDPVGQHSHAVTVRQVLRYYLLLEQQKLVSRDASIAMRGIFESPDIPHLQDKFVKGLAGRPVEIIRKSGWWEDWFHDTAVVTGPGRHYIVVALTHHPKGDAYLEAFAPAVDDALKK